MQKIELKETNNFDISFISFNFTNKYITVIKNDNIVKNEELNINVKDLEELIKKFVIYWDNEYIDRKIISGSKGELDIYTDEEVIKYYFENKYPYNYDEFLKSFKEMLFYE